MKEFRRAPRRKLASEVEVLDTMTGESIGTLGNLSESGMLLIASRAGLDDALYQLRFQLQIAPGELKTLDVGVHQLWSEPAPAPSTWWTGYRFIDIAPADLKRLRAWAEHPDAIHA